MNAAAASTQTVAQAEEGLLILVDQALGRSVELSIELVCTFAATAQRAESS